MPSNKKLFLFLIFLFNIHSVIFGYEYNLAVCTIFKNNAPYLKEWLEFHKLQGVEHFYLYDNSSTDDPISILAPYIEEGVVTLHNWPNRNVEKWIQGENWVSTTQIAAYQHCKQAVESRVKWLALIDTDEFIVPISIYSILEYLQQHEHIPAFFLWWRVYGTSGVWDIPPNRLMIELLVKRFPSEHYRNQQGKVIIRPEEVVDFNGGSHHAICRNNGCEYIISPEEIRINHYASRTISFCITQKGSDKAVMENRDVPEHEKNMYLYEGNDIEDRIMDRFIPELRNRMGYDTNFMGNHEHDTV